MAQSLWPLQERRRLQSRPYSRFLLDEFYLETYRLLMQLTKLRGERRDKRIGQIASALELGSPELESVRKRFRRIPAEMWRSLPPDLRRGNKAQLGKKDP